MVQVVRRTRYLTPEGTVKEIVGEEHDFSYRHSVFSQGEDVISSSVLELEPGQEEKIRAQMAELAQKRKSKHALESSQRRPCSSGPRATSPLPH